MWGDSVSAPRRKPEGATPLPVRLVRRARISPGFVRVTLAGPALADYEALGDDQWFRLFLPAEGGEIKTMSMTVASALAYAVTPVARRPLIRNYTTWAYRPAQASQSGEPELDLDVFADGHHSGPGVDWLLDADEGAEAKLLDEGCLYLPPTDATTHLLVGDESALPAILGILRDATPDWRGDAIIEVANPDDRRDADVPAGATLTWVVREAGQPCGSAAADAAEKLDAPAEGYYYVAGPSAMVKRLRRHLVARGVPKPRIGFVGYWREGRRSP